jgi:hypothetical protein
MLFIHSYAYALLKGSPCNHRGSFLPSGMPPAPSPPKSTEDWTPFASRAGFELTEILYLKAHLSQTIINDILDIWSATLVPHDDVPPITSHRHLHSQIDAIGLGNIPWRSYTAQYQWLRPENGPVPEWMRTKYPIWYRDPRQVIHHILANPEFVSGIDYAPHRDFKDGERQYGDFMSGDWSWEQCVGQRYCTPTTYSQLTHRISLRWILQHMGLCSFPSSSAPIRQLFPSLLVSMNTTLFISRLGMSITAFGEHTNTHSSSLVSFQFLKVYSASFSLS